MDTLAPPFVTLLKCNVGPTSSPLPSQAPDPRPSCVRYLEIQRIRTPIYIPSIGVGIDAVLVSLSVLSFLFSTAKATLILPCQTSIHIPRHRLCTRDGMISCWITKQAGKSNPEKVKLTTPPQSSSADLVDPTSFGLICHNDMLALLATSVRAVGQRIGRTMHRHFITQSIYIDMIGISTSGSRKVVATEAKSLEAGRQLYSDSVRSYDAVALLWCCVASTCAIVYPPCVLSDASVRPKSGSRSAYCSTDNIGKLLHQHGTQYVFRTRVALSAVAKLVVHMYTEQKRANVTGVKIFHYKSSMAEDFDT
ncbi:hypothetical protein V8B97DRAFT_1913365 [Scleroderma yunnanense]